MWVPLCWGSTGESVIVLTSYSTFFVTLALFDRFEGGGRVFGGSQGCRVRTMCSSVHCSSRRACSSRVNWPCLVRISSFTWAHDDRAAAEIQGHYKDIISSSLSSDACIAGVRNLFDPGSLGSKIFINVFQWELCNIFMDWRTANSSVHLASNVWFFCPCIVLLLALPDILGRQFQKWGINLFHRATTM